MSIDLEFSRHAHTYKRYSVIQDRVATQLLQLLRYKPKRILDLGCGRGALIERIDWEIEHFLGVDFAKNMLELHPKDRHIECIYADFDDSGLFEHLYIYDFDYILSASAMQWSSDIDRLFGNVAALNANDYAFAIFCAGTFQTLHRTAGIDSPLRSSEEVLASANRHFTCKHRIERYRLAFDDTLAMLRYIKRSGVSGNRAVLGYKETKELLRSYPLRYLEFEVLFIYT